MKKALFLLTSILIVLTAWPQDFYREEFNHRKRYVILANPTVRNIEVIHFLISRKIFDVNQKKIKFVGIYHEGQAYDFSKTASFIKESGLKNFFLHEVRGKINENNLFEENGCTEDFKTIIDNSIGALFFGGPDIPPEIYGEENTASFVSDPVRHYFEVSFLFHLLGGFQDETFTPLIESKPDYLTVGFCLGLQTLNIATGGTLVQDIPSEIYNANEPKEILEIGRNNLHRNYWQEIVEDSLLMGINLHRIQFSEYPFFGGAIKLAKGWLPRIYSSHHQAVENTGKGMEITAYSIDGKVVEGLAHREYPNVFAVQFHPEVPALYEDLYKRKFHPEDLPMTYNDIIGRQSVRFHKLFWKHISKTLSSLR